MKSKLFCNHRVTKFHIAMIEINNGFNSSVKMPVFLFGAKNKNTHNRDWIIIFILYISCSDALLRGKLRILN